MFIRRLLELLQKRKIPYAIAGGYAVALHGAVRGTVDIDLVISLDAQTLLRIEQAMAELGLVSRIPVGAKEIAQFRNEYIKERNLKAWSFVNPSRPMELVDILIIYELRDFKTVKRKSVFGDLVVVSLPDLIRMKRESGRQQDLVDIEALSRLGITND